MADKAYVAQLPKCDWCDRPAHYDFKTVMGPWGNGCEEHYLEYRESSTLGTGKGQKLIAIVGQKEVKRYLVTIELNTPNRELMIINGVKAESEHEAETKASRMIIDDLPIRSIRVIKYEDD